MSKINLTSLLFVGSLALQGCAQESDSRSPDISELDDGLATLGKADASTSVVELYANGVGLRGAAARTLYNLLDDAGVQGQTGQGRRALYAPGMGCITDGVASYCLLLGDANQGNGAYDAIVHGSVGGSSASTLYGLLAEGSGDSFVSTPWFACERNGGAVWCGVESSVALQLDFDGLEDSGEDFVYEGWAVSQGVATTTDRFRQGPALVQHVPASIADDSIYVLTIEPRRGDASAPAKTHLLAGELELGGETSLGTEHPAALGTNFASAQGGFILATPTSATSDDETQGIWFVNPALGESSLDLPELPEGWAYEGWVVGAEGPISTGRFTSTEGDDSDGAGPSAGPGMSPPFPGQDFVSPAMDLVGTTAVISVEPEPDNAAAPFAIKPLIAPEVGSELAPTLQVLGNTSENRPAATARFGL